MKIITVTAFFSGMLILVTGCMASQGYNVAGTETGAKSSAININPQLMVSVHNKWRADVGVAGLKWSSALAKKAVAWATELKDNNSCRMKHSGPGENLFWASATTLKTSRNGVDWERQELVQEISEQQVVDSWGSEKNWYSPGSNNCNAPAGQSCGHYTQMVWEGSTEVGCGKTICPDNSQVWVCNYSPPGNIVGQSPY